VDRLCECVNEIKQGCELMNEQLQEPRANGLKYLSYLHRDDESLIDMRARHEQEFINYLEQFLPKELRNEDTDS
jgi:hypothetical protein